MWTWLQHDMPGEPSFWCAQVCTYLGLQIQGQPIAEPPPFKRLLTLVPGLASLRCDGKRDTAFSDSAMADLAAINALEHLTELTFADVSITAAFSVALLPALQRLQALHLVRCGGVEDIYIDDTGRMGCASLLGNLLNARTVTFLLGAPA